MFTVSKETDRTQFICSSTGEKLHRIVCGNIIDYSYGNGVICTHKALALFKHYH